MGFRTAGASSRVPPMCSAVRWASAMQVSIGLAPDGGRERAGVADPDAATSCSSPVGRATDVAGSVPMRAMPIWWALPMNEPARADGDPVELVAPRLEVLAALPDARRGAEPQLLGAGRLVQPRHDAQALAVRRDVALVGQGVGVHRLAGVVDRHLPAAVVAQHEQEVGHPPELAHRLLGLLAVAPGELEGEDAGVVLRALDEQPVAVAEVAELVHDRGLRRSPPRLLVLGVDAEDAGARVQVQVLPDRRAADAGAQQQRRRLERAARDDDVRAPGPRPTALAVSGRSYVAATPVARPSSTRHPVGAGAARGCARRASYASRR